MMVLVVVNLIFIKLKHMVQHHLRMKSVYHNHQVILQVNFQESLQDSHQCNHLHSLQALLQCNQHVNQLCSHLVNLLQVQVGSLLPLLRAFLLVSQAAVHPCSHLHNHRVNLVCSQRCNLQCNHHHNLQWHLVCSLRCNQLVIQRHNRHQSRRVLPPVNHRQHLVGSLL